MTGAGDERLAELGIRARDEMCNIEAGTVGEQACKIDRRKLLRLLDEARAEIARLRAPAGTDVELAAARERLHNYVSTLAALSPEQRQRILAYAGPEISGDLPRRAPAGGDLVERARRVYDTIAAFGWEITWRSTNQIPDDAWPVDIIATFATAVQREAREAAIEEAALLCEREAASHGSLNDGYIRRELANLIRVLSSTAPPSGWRHKKRGSVYAEVARGELQKSGDYVLKEGDRLVTYRGSDGRVWHRYEPEFDDGRFERLPAPPTEDATG